MVSDQFGSPTNAADLAQIILNILIKINNKDVEIFISPMKGSARGMNFQKKYLNYKIFKFMLILLEVVIIQQKQSALNTVL